MVVIRMSRVGRRNLPVYTLVAADSRRPRDGRF
jgi:ribosomal protein S16